MIAALGCAAWEFLSHLGKRKHPHAPWTPEEVAAYMAAIDQLAEYMHDTERYSRREETRQ